MVLGNTLPILRPPVRSTPPVQTGWNEDLVKNMHDVLGRLQQQISATTSVSTASLTSFDTKAALEAATVLAVVDALLLTGYTTAGDSGGALYKREGSEPSHNLKVQSVDGAWWELVPDGHISFIACGGVEGDDAANGAGNVTAFNSFIGYAQAFSVGNANQTSAPTLLFPKGHYHFNNHLNVKASCHIIGESGFGIIAAGGTKLEFPTDKYGFIFHREDTIDLTSQASDFHARGSTIQRLHILGGGNTNTTGCGIWMRAPIAAKDLFITEFAEDGIKVEASVSGGASTVGNANLWRLENVTCQGNGRHGLFVDLPDSNVGLIIGGDFRNNARWGVYASEAFGGTYIGLHTSGNGVATKGGNPSGESSYVHLAGRRYSAHVDASEAQLVATTPGTDETIWIDTESGGSSGTIPTWLTSQSEGTYFHGGSYRTEGASNRSVFIGCYRETNQAAGQILDPAVTIGGLFGNNRGDGTQIIDKKWIGSVSFSNDETHFTNFDREIDLLINNQKNNLIKAKPSGDSANGLNLLAWDESDLLYLIGQHANSSSRKPIRITSDLSTGTKAGRTSALRGGSVIFGQGLWVGANRNDARFISNGTAAPSSGEYARGDIIWNRNMSVGQPTGWACTVAGTPGTWVAMANL